MKLWLNVREGAEYAGVCRDTIYTACERGRAAARACEWATSDRPEARNGSMRGSSGTRRTFRRTDWRRDGGHVMRGALPVLLTVDEAADLLRTTRRAIYAMIERRQLPGVIRVRRRVLLRADDLLDWLDQKRAPSPEE